MVLHSRVWNRCEFDERYEMEAGPSNFVCWLVVRRETRDIVAS
jgi:hypothetical protein